MTDEKNNEQVEDERLESETKEEQNEGVDGAPAEKATDEEHPTADGEQATEDSVVSELQRTVEQLESEREELKDRMLRVQADYDNFRRRTKEEKAAAAKYQAQNLAEKILPVLDNFERALNVDVESEESQSVLKGMDIVYRQLKEALEAENIQEIEAEGQPFDPHFHQAVMQVEHEGYESNTVVEVMEKGYQLHDRVIRPAMVKVTA